MSEAHSFSSEFFAHAANRPSDQRQCFRTDAEDVAYKLPGLMHNLRVRQNGVGEIARVPKSERDLRDRLICIYSADYDIPGLAILFGCTERHVYRVLRAQTLPLRPDEGPDAGTQDPDRGVA